MKITVLSIGFIFMSYIAEADSEGCYRIVEAINGEYLVYSPNRPVAPSIDKCVLALEIGTPIGRSGRYIYEGGWYEILVTKNNSFHCSYHGQIPSKQCE